MAYVVRIYGVRPIGRDDGVKWTQARLEEAVVPAGPWDTRETQAVPGYPNAAAPPSMSFTMTTAQLEVGWYRAVFVDDAGNIDPTSARSLSGAGILLPPTAAEVRARSKLLQDLFPETPVDADVEFALQETVADATALVESLTCRSLDGSLGSQDLDRLAMRAVTLKAESVGKDAVTAKAVRGRINVGRLRSFSAGPYSESYFGPDEAAKAQRLDPDLATHEVLWALATEDCRAAWLALWGGDQPPAAAVQSFAWRARRGRVRL